MPTRNGRHGLAFTRFGPINIKNAHHADDPRPLDAESRCPAARDFSRAYLHHLFHSRRGARRHAASMVNLYYYQDLIAGARAAIAASALPIMSRNRRTVAGKARYCGHNRYFSAKMKLHVQRNPEGVV